ncbi:MAG: hypothetical protein Q9216_003199 [Gyalolechia sp. 2 TL-2023]
MAVIPSVSSEDSTTRKRKKHPPTTDPGHKPLAKARKLEKNGSRTAKVEEKILLLESQIVDSRQHYNKIPTLIRYCQDHHEHSRRAITAAVAVCRTFSRLMAVGIMSKSRNAPENEVVIVQWLRRQFEVYRSILLDLLASDDPTMQSTALTLLMRLLKEEAESLGLRPEKVWRDGAFPSIVLGIANSASSREAREEFVGKYMQPYDDVRYYGFACLSDICNGSPSQEVLDNVISLLNSLAYDVGKEQGTDRLYIAKSDQSRSSISLHITQQKQAQELWLKILKNDLTRPQRKTILGMMTLQIAPWFTRLELLLDFLTDSFNAGGSMSLAALSGLFHLMQEKNLDFPQFYPKLYSLLSPDILHSKHRSRFFRLLDTFLSSTHLPVALVASFIKRLSRLALSAPPSGIVVVVPWIYNLLRNHPSCTFMIHRKLEHSAAATGGGMDDPFDMAESDPMETNAIDSSLWEIQSLQTHYHPNVATIAKIISEPFTKQAYDLEDFLDHSYSSMLGAELTKEMKKTPVVEYEIPKKIFLRNTDSPDKDSLLLKLWDFS